MDAAHYKSIRRQILLELYNRFLRDPLEAAEPEAFLDAGMEKHALAVNAHYLADRGLAELIMGYHPPLFSTLRITHRGVDLVENRYRLDLEFPPLPDAVEAANADIPVLVERLADEAEYVPLDGDHRQALLRDAAWLRGEAARPAARWRGAMMLALLDAMDRAVEGCDPALPSLPRLRERVAQITAGQ